MKKPITRSRRTDRSRDSGPFPDEEEGPTSDQASARRVVAAWMYCFLFLAVGLTTLQHLVTLPRPFAYPHAWGAAGAVVDARAFRTFGIAALKAVPMHNNPPFGAHPEAYVHWPPLLSLLLTFWFNVFGESETATHAFTFVQYLVTTGLLYWLIASNLGRLAAAIGTLSWLTLPVTLRYSHVILNETLGLAFGIFALIALQKALSRSPYQSRWRAAGAAAIVFAVLASWHFVFLPIGLLAAALWNRSVPERRIALLYLSAAVGTAAAVIGWYMFAYPDLWLDTLESVIYRLGLPLEYTLSPLHNLASNYRTMSVPAMLQAEALNVARMIGFLGLTALAGFVLTQGKHWRQRPASGSLIVFCGLIFPPLLWLAIFKNQAAIHEFVAILLAPIVAYGIAACAVKLMDSLASTSGTFAWGAFWAMAILGPVLLVMPLLRQLHGSAQLVRTPGQLLPSLEPSPAIMESDDDMRLGLVIRDNTAPLSVVLTPALSSVPVYYSGRHMITGVTSDADIAKVLPLIRRDFRGYPLYLALLARDRASFPSALAGHRTPSQAPPESEDSIVVEIPY